jgi:hypothetical protein
MADVFDPTRARAPVPEEFTQQLHERGARVELEHDELKARAERVRIAWAETSEGTEPTKRAKRKLRDKAREFSGLALATLVDACMTGDTTASRVAAAKELLDRGFGKSTEHVEIDDKRDNEAARVVAELEALRKNPDTAAALLTLAEASAKLNTKARD